MGVVVNVNGYKKDRDYITGEIKLLGWYEVDINIDNDKNKISNSETHIRYELSIFKIATEEYSRFGLIGPSDVSFIHNISDNISGGGYRVENGKTYVIMFDAKRLLKSIEQLLHNIGEVNFDPETMKMEKENLSYFEKSLRIIAEEDGMVWMSIG